MGVYIKNWSLADWKELLKWAKIGANNAMIGEFTEVEEIPTHGRLIDADELKKIVANAKHMDAGIFDGKTMYSDHLCIGADYDDVCAAIDDTPTIIPAEEDDT